MLKYPQMEESMVDKKKCIGCGTCVAICPVEAISFSKEGYTVIDQKKCIKCGACQASCPVNAIKIK